MAFNLNSIRKSNTGYRGVSFIKRKQAYQASLSLTLSNGKHLFKFIGYYPTAELAYIARINYIDNLK